ncbi:MAG TPA: nuclear transport factor 2 family protein [Stellaceae bacterium]|nr:nuclear transport factor 2 family protein [Stellaceae bacterium]
MSPAKQLVLDYVAAFNAGDIERVRALFASDARIWGVLGSGGLDVAAPIWRELHDAMGMHLEVKALVEEGNSVSARFVETGCFVAPFRGLAGHVPTGRNYEINAIEWFEIADGRITNRWGARDSAAITRQVLG